MLTKDRLIILQSGTALTGAICRIGLKRRDIVCCHRVACAERSPDSVAAGLRSLLEALNREGPRPAEVRLCLSSENVLFRDWTFPFRSRNKVEQALGLMLETEFPFDPEQLAHRVSLTGNAAASSGLRNGAQALSTSLRREDLDFWLNALAAEGLFPSLVSVDPFPLLAGLPPRQSGLLLHVQRTHSTLALLDNGVIRRIRVLAEGFDPERRQGGQAALPELAARLAREAELALEKAPVVPEKCLVYGEIFLSGGASSCLAEALGLPVSVLGQDLPLSGQVARLGETDPDRLLALCTASLPSPTRWSLLPSFHRAASSGLLSGAGKRLLWAAGGILCVGMAALLSIWAEGYAEQRRAQQHETASRELFRKALPDVRASFNPVQMESILKTRISGLRSSDDEVAFPVLRLLQAMHAAVPPSLGVRIDRMSLDSRRCGISGTAAGYDQVNALRTALSGIDGVGEAKILSAANRTGKPEAGEAAGAILFEIELALEGGRS